MATIDFNKENLRPLSSDDAFQDGLRSPSSKKGGRKGRSKSIGPGALDELNNMNREDSKDRRKSAFLPATKSILSRNEDAQKAARRRTMGNRRVSFAPEATLHTWDVIELGRDQTTSTDSTDSTRRASNFTRASTPSSDGEDQPSSPRTDEDQEVAHSKKSRRSSGVPPMNFNNPDDIYSSSIASDESGSEEEESEGNDEEDDDGDENGSEDDTGTAMSIDTDDNTVRSAAGSEESTGSSARLEASLRQAAQTAGTRGIEYDEYGDMSMEMAGDEITNAFKPWAQTAVQDEGNSASMDQENINPFLLASAVKPSQGSDDGDMSMDMTYAMGGIVKDHQNDPQSSPFGDATMEMTQAVGKITSTKRRRSTADTGSPGANASSAASKRRRSSGARSSMGDESMELTMAVGGIHDKSSPAQPRRTRSSTAKRRSSGVASEADEVTGTMDLTRAVGGIRTSSNSGDDNGFDGNEELSMELTTAIGGLKAGSRASQSTEESPRTPQGSNERLDSAADLTATDQDQTRGADVQETKQMLSPIVEADVTLSSKRISRRKSRTSNSPAKKSSPARTTPPHDDEKPVLVDEVANTEHTTSPQLKQVISYPELSNVEQAVEQPHTPQENPERQNSYQTPESDVKRQLDAQLQPQILSPTAEKQNRNTPIATAATPERGEPTDDGRTLAQSIKMLSTPRKETLKNVSPVKQSPTKAATPRQNTPRNRPTPKSRSTAPTLPAQRLDEDLTALQSTGKPLKKVGLQEFLTDAGIRFMDLTTTKRRVTTVSTPLKDKAAALSDEDVAEEEEEEASLESSVVAAACTAPELDLYRHACHELKRYTKEGKQMVMELEEETLKENSPLIQAYVNTELEKRTTLDMQMRDMKTNARFRSKELWYSWRSKLLDELMVGLQKIGEGLIKDDELLGSAEEVLDSMLPGLFQEQEALQQEARNLQETANTMTDEEKAEVQEVRAELGSVNTELVEKQRELEKLRREVQGQDTLASDLNESKLEFTAAIQEANRVREACRGVSVSEVTALRDSVKQLEDASGWAITSASSSPSTVTMTYKSQLELTFQPAAFQQPSDRPNAPIRLTYVADVAPHSKRPLTTSLRFFLQLLRAALQALPQSTTRIADLLALVSEGWDTAATLAETERRLGIEASTESRIVDDERLDITTAILLPQVRTKVHVTFAVTAWVGTELRLRTAVEPQVRVVYGEEYHEKNMTEFMRGQMGDGLQDWDCALQEIRAKLVARGVKGSRK